VLPNMLLHDIYSVHSHYRSTHALNSGVKRAHLIPPGKGAILKELYTGDGAGMLISRDVYEGIRAATAADVMSVEEIIRPLEEEGILVPRSRDQLEKEMADCFLVCRDSAVLACGMLKRLLINLLFLSVCSPYYIAL
jgi:amino-acid N-acetyltransferase